MTPNLDRLKTTLSAHPVLAVGALGAVALCSLYAAALLGIVVLAVLAWPTLARARDPEARASSAVAAMRQQTLRVVQTVSSVMADELLLQRALEREQFHCRLWATRSEKALLTGDEAEAVRCIVRRQEHEAAVEKLRPELEKQRATVRGLRPQVDALRLETQAAEQSGEMLALRARRAAAKRRVVLTVSGLETKAGEESFRRLADDVARAEAEAEALETLMPGVGDDHAETWERRERAEAVGRELEVLRGRMGMKRAMDEGVGAGSSG
jgi:phage shock protein A